MEGRKAPPGAPIARPWLAPSRGRAERLTNSALPLRRSPERLPRSPWIQPKPALVREQVLPADFPSVYPEGHRECLGVCGTRKHTNQQRCEAIAVPRIIEQEPAGRRVPHQYCTSAVDVRRKPVRFSLHLQKQMRRVDANYDRDVRIYRPLYPSGATHVSISGLTTAAAFPIYSRPAA